MINNPGPAINALNDNSGQVRPVRSRIPEDAGPNGFDALYTNSRPNLFNEATWDRERGNTELTVLASAARTASINSNDQINYNARGVMVWFNITVVPGVDTVQLLIQIKDPVSGTYSTILTDTAQSAIGTRVAAIYPAIAAAAEDVNIVRGYPLPRTWRVRIVHSAATSFTYSVGAALIL